MLGRDPEVALVQNGGKVAPAHREPPRLERPATQASVAKKRYGTRFAIFQKASCRIAEQ